MGGEGETSKKNRTKNKKQKTKGRSFTRHKTQSVIRRIPSNSNPITQKKQNENVQKSTAYNPQPTAQTSLGTQSTQRHPKYPKQPNTRHTSSSGGTCTPRQPTSSGSGSCTRSSGYRDSQVRVVSIIVVWTRRERE